MAKKVIVRRNGNSNVIAIPPAFCEALQISRDSVLNIETDRNRIIMTPIREVESKENVDTEAKLIAPANLNQ